MRRASSAVRAAVGRVSRSPASDPRATASSSSSTEPRRQPGDDERGGLAIDVRPVESRPRTPHGRTTSASVRPASMCGPGSSMRSSPAGPRTPVRNSTDERCPSPTARRLRMNRQLPGGEARLVGMHDGRRVEQGRRLDRVLVGEPGAHEAAALVGQLGVVGYPVRDPLVVAPSARPAGPGAAPRSGHAPASRSRRPRRRAARGSATGPPTPGTDHRARARDRARTAAPAPAPGPPSGRRRSA